MKAYPNWEYDEYKQIGTDYGKQDEVDVYDSSHAEFRNIAEECSMVLELLDLKECDKLIDFGAGTGDFAIRAAGCCAKIYAVDVSATMIEYAKRKAIRAGVSNIEFCLGGFLSYEHKGSEAEAIVTSLALHHLPDFWKGIALSRMHAMLKTGGRLFIRDVVLESGAPLENIANFVRQQERIGGDFLRKDAEGHFREEFSTYDWVMEGLLERAGFEIVEMSFSGGIFAEYLCKKK